MCDNVDTAGATACAGLLDNLRGLSFELLDDEAWAAALETINALETSGAQQVGGGAAPPAASTGGSGSSHGVEEDFAAPRKRGRPKGSTNKPQNSLIPPGASNRQALDALEQQVQARV
jgi:hypothetical protein